MRTSRFLVPVLLAAIASLNLSGARAQADSFEPAPTLNTVDFLSSAEITGPHHRVELSVANNGLNNLYVIESDYGRFTPLGTSMARIRIHEIGAIAILKATETDEAAGGGAVEAGKDKLDTVKTIVANPVDTLKSMPKGASRFFGSIGEALKGNRSDYEGNTTEVLLGVSEARRKLAASLKVSPYTSNPVLREELTRVAGAKGITDRLLNIGLGVVTGGATAVVVTSVGISETLLEQIASEPPAQVRIEVRKQLLSAGASKDVVEAFLDSPRLSPVHLAVIAEALVSTGAETGLDTVLSTYRQARSEGEALYLMRAARLLARYHGNVAPLTQLRITGIHPTGLDSQGNLVIPLPMDYASWTERNAATVEHLASLPAEDEMITGIVVYT
ncbi:MAG: hypothetical protein ACC661_08815, partial [Verrucomicrobiales bacterium]